MIEVIQRGITAMAHVHIHNINNKFLFSILLNMLFIIVEIFYGIKSNSVALIADAAHNAGDMFGLLVAWFGFWIAHKKAPPKFTFGFKKATVIAAFINAILLFVAVGGIVWEAIGRIGQQTAINSGTIIVVAAIGVVINGLTAYIFSHDRHADINIKGAFLHMALDALVSLGVIAAGILMLWKTWAWIDPVVSLVIAGIILISSWSLFRESLDLMLLAVPNSIDIKKLKQLMHKHEGLIGYHDLHVWPLSTTEVALSAHLMVTQANFNHHFATNLEQTIKQQFAISHVTLQLELAESL
jgi:cobalt-zinc-cadmium efflux system protein